MCVTCEHMLYEEHRCAEIGKFRRCRKCKKFPSNGAQQCYHCFAIGQTIAECPECQGKPWSEEFQLLKAEIESGLSRLVQ